MKSLLQNRCVLVVDDVEDMRVLIAASLRSRGAEVLTASSAESALRVLHSIRPHAIVSDLCMPDRDGYSMMAEIRQTNPEIPAVAVSCHANAEDRVKSCSSGFHAHLAKPVNFEHLTKLLISLTALAP